jgi:hypothetical protein
MRRAQGAALWCRGGSRAMLQDAPLRSPMLILVVAEEEWRTQLGCVVGAIAFRVVERRHIYSARAGGRRGQGRGGVAAVLHADHLPGDTITDQIQGDICVGDGDDLINRVGFAAAQVVG